MESLEDRQREMKKRNTQKQRGEGVALPQATPDDLSEILALKQRVSELQEKVVALQAENSRLRERKTIVVERPEQSRSSGDSVKEQQHNFFKYSNARRRY
jgi:regulator of replication initiation timing